MNEKIELVKVNIIKELPLLAPLIYKFKFVEDKNIKDIEYKFSERSVYYNPEYINKIPGPDLTILILKEFLHLLFYHNIENIEDEKDRIIINLTTEAIVNETIKNLGFKLPTGSILLEDLKRIDEKLRSYNDEELSKMSHIDITNILKQNEMFKEITENIEEGKDVNNLIEKITSKYSLDKTTKELLKKNIKESIERKEYLNENEKKEIKELIEKGLLIEKIKGENKRYIEKLINIILGEGIINWKKILRSMFSEIELLSIDYDFTKRSRKSDILYYTKGFQTFIPSIEKEEENNFNIIIGIDVSDSITDEEYSEFVNEIYNLVKDYNIDGYIILWDVDIRETIKINERIKNNILEKLKNRKGYGGTIIESFFKKAERLSKRKNKTYLIIFTDGYIENVEKSWIDNYKKVIFVISKNGITAKLNNIESLSNVLITRLYGR